MMNIVVALLLFGLIVLFHEFGHFLAARLMGVRVIEFAVGMGPKLLSFRGRETVYSIRALPLGGFCSMLGEDGEEESEEAVAGTTAETEAANAADLTARGMEATERKVTESVFMEASAAEPAPDSLSAKSPWQRFVIIFAGPLFNFILAFFLALLIIAQAGADRCTLEGVTEGYPAAEAGVMAGDTITAIDGRKIVFFRELTDYLYFHPGKPVEIEVLRGAGEARQELSFSLTPKLDSRYGSYMLGVRVQGGRSPVHGFKELFYYAAQETRFQISSTVEGLSMMLRGVVSVSSLTGPVGIVGSIGETVEESRQYGMAAVLLNLINVGLLLSANLGVVNLLPLPALDGGRLVFCLIEGVFRRPVNRRAEGYVHFAGFVLLMLLMVVVMFNDIGRLAG